MRHLLDKSKFDQALALAEDVLKSHSNNAAALEIATLALEGKKEARSAVLYARRLLSVQITEHQMPAAADTLFRLLRQMPQPGSAANEARLYLTALVAADRPAVEAGRLLLSRLRGADASTYRWLADFITTQTSLGLVLMPPPGALGPDDPLPLRPGLGQSVTARHVIEAIDRGNSLVDGVRAALLSPNLPIRRPRRGSGRRWSRRRLTTPSA